MKKSKVLFLVVSMLMVASLLLAACKPAAPAEEAPAEGEKVFKAAMLTDLGGLSGSEDTKGFTDLCWDGFVKARDELGIEILLIEDNAQNSYMTCFLLGHRGHVVTVAQTGPEGPGQDDREPDGVEGTFAAVHVHEQLAYGSVHRPMPPPRPRLPASP